MYNGRRLTKSALCIFLISNFRVSRINYYLLCSLPIHKICALCGIFSTISVLLTTQISDDLEIRIPEGSRSLKLIPVNLSCVISYYSLIVTEVVYEI